MILSVGGSREIMWNARSWPGPGWEPLRNLVLRLGGQGQNGKVNKMTETKTLLHTYVFRDTEDGTKLAKMTYQPYRVLNPQVGDKWELWDDDCLQFFVYEIKEVVIWPEQTEVGLKRYLPKKWN
jgi:hypothetical protein